MVWIRLIQRFIFKQNKKPTNDLGLLWQS